MSMVRYNPWNIHSHLQNEINIDKGVSTTKGERSRKLREESDGSFWVKRPHGTFYWRLALPDGADANGIGARGRHGAFEIDIPEEPKTNPRAIHGATHWARPGS